MKKIVLDKKLAALFAALLLVGCLLTFFITRALSVRVVHLDWTGNLTSRAATQDGPFPLLNIGAREGKVQLSDSGRLLLRVAVESDKHWLRYGPVGENYVDNNSLNMLGARLDNLDLILQKYDPESVDGILDAGDYFYALLGLPEGQCVLPCMRGGALNPDQPISFAEFQQRLIRQEGNTGSGSEPVESEIGNQE